MKYYANFSDFVDGISSDICDFEFCKYIILPIFHPQDLYKMLYLQRKAYRKEVFFSFFLGFNGVVIAARCTATF